MSDNKTTPTPPPTPVAKTSAVPLKKETVRITLRARPGAGVTQPKEVTGQVPSSTTSQIPSMASSQIPSITSRVPAAASRMTSPVALSSPATALRPATSPVAPANKSTSPIQLPSAPLPPPAARPATAPVQVAPAKLPPPPSVPLRPPTPTVGGPPRAPGAPPPPPGAPRPPIPAATVPLAKAPNVPKPLAPGAPPAPAGPKVEAGATTVPLAAKPQIAKPGGTGTAPMSKTGGGAGTTTAQLPKATVKLQQTVGMAKAPQIAAPALTAKAAEEGDEAAEEKDPEAGLMPLAAICTVIAAIVMVINLFGNDKLQMWGEDSFLLPPAPVDPKWEQKGADGVYVSKFQDTLKNITRDVVK